jgi:hypothetical protein
MGRGAGLVWKEETRERKKVDWLREIGPKELREYRKKGF